MEESGSDPWGASDSAMDHPMHDLEARQLWAELANPQSASFLRHVLGCSQCRDLALVELGEWVGDRPPAPSAAPDRKTRKEAEWLLAELLRMAPAQRDRSTEEARFHKAVLLDLILEKSQDALSEDTSQADELAWLAVAIGSSIDSDADWLRTRLTRAFSLAGHARRLGGHFQEADAAFDDAAHFLTGTAHESALFCRAVALLRWEQGRLAESAGLLRYAAECFAEAGDQPEMGATLALAGLLYMEANNAEKALGLLLRARLSLDPEVRPGLTVRIALSLALCLAALDKPEEAGEILQDAWSHYSRVTDPAELLLCEWLEGRIAARLDSPTHAKRLLDSARRKLFLERRFSEAALASLDLALLYAEMERHEEIDAVIVELEERTTGWPGRDIALESLRQFASEELKTAEPRKRAEMLGLYMRQAFRLRRLGAGALPWI